MLGHGQEVEDPAAAVVQAHDLQVHAAAACREQASRVVLQRQLADQDPGGQAAGDRGAHGGRHHAVDPVRAAVGEEPQPLGRLGEVGLDVADRHRGAHPDDGRVGQLRLEAREDLALEPIGRVLDRRPRPWRPPRASPRASPRRAPLTSSPPRTPEHPESGRPRPGARARRSAWARARRHAGPPRSVSTPDERAKRLRRGHVAHAQHEARRVPAHEALDA